MKDLMYYKQILLDFGDLQEKTFYHILLRKTALIYSQIVTNNVFIRNFPAVYIINRYHNSSVIIEIFHMHVYDVKFKSYIMTWHILLIIH